MYLMIEIGHVDNCLKDNLDINNFFTCLIILFQYVQIRTLKYNTSNSYTGLKLIYQSDLPNVLL